MKLSCFAIIIFLCMITTSIAAEFPVCTEGQNQKNPDISLDTGTNCPIVVWEDYRNDSQNGDIYGKYLALDESCEQLIMPPISVEPSSKQEVPAVDGTIVVWQDNRSGNGWYIWGSNLSMGLVDKQICPETICGSGREQRNADISGNYVVWEDCEGTSCDIYGIEIDPDTLEATSALISICTAEQHQFNPAISGDIVVWQDVRGPDCDIRAYRISTEETWVVCEIAGYQGYPAISGDIIVWEDWRSGDPDDDKEIYYASASIQEPQEGTLISPEELEDNQLPAIYGDVVVWFAKEGSNTTYNLYAKNIYEEEYYLISEMGSGSNGSNLGKPAISNISKNIVAVWQDEISDFDIFGRRVGLEAEFVADFPIASHPLRVNYTDKSFSTVGEISWEWDFGDGTAHSFLQNPYHEYNLDEDRSFTVSLTTTAGGGSFRAKKEVEDFVNLLPTYNIEMFDVILKRMLDYWNDEDGTWDGADMYDATSFAPYILYRLAIDPAIPQNMQVDCQELANATIDYYIERLFDLFTQPWERTPEKVVENFNFDYITQNLNDDQYELFKEVVAGLPCLVDGLDYYDGQAHQNFLFDDTLHVALVCANIARTICFDETTAPSICDEIVESMADYGKVFILGGLLATAYQYADVTTELNYILHARFSGWSTYQYLINHYWAENGPCRDNIEYTHFDGGPTYCNFFHDPNSEYFPYQQAIAWENASVMTGLAKMYETTGNPYCKDYLIQTKCTFDEYHWNPEDFNPYPPPTPPDPPLPLHLGYCILPDREKSNEPEADLSDNIGFAWAYTRFYEKEGASEYLAKAEEIFNDIVIGGFQYTQSEEYHNFIGLSWIDIEDIEPEYLAKDIPGQFIARHHHFYDGNLNYLRATKKCTGCNFVLLNSLYDFLKAKEEWPEEWTYPWP